MGTNKCTAGAWSTICSSSWPTTAKNVAVWYDGRMSTKQRLSASVDAEVLEAAEAAVAAGRAVNVSSWVNEALRRQIEHDRRMLALDAFVEAYEAQHGPISEREMRDASQRARARAIVVRGSPKRARRPSRRV